MFYSIRYFLLFIFVAFVIVGCGINRDDNEIIDYNAELAKGWQEYNSGNYKSAVLAFEKVISDDVPANIIGDSYNGLGWAYMNISQSVNINRANLDIAIAKFQKSIEKDKDNYDAMVGLAVALFIRQNSADDYQKALEIVDLAINKDSIYLYRHDYKSKADLYALKAQCYYRLGEFDNAESESNNALSIDSDNKTALSIKTLLY